MRTVNAFGSELLPLAVPLRTETFDGSGFPVETDDNCTPYTSPGLTFTPGSYTGHLDPGEVTASGAGKVFFGQQDDTNPLVLHAPAAPLAGPGNGNEGSVEVALDVPPWLEFDWAVDGVLRDPRATATFGIFHGDDAVIYLREMY
jgi:MSHA biogenesis protein MshQ